MLGQQFDLISDIHVDFWVNQDNKRMSDFVRSLLPTTPSRVLVIAGDIGHYNSQNELLLNELKHYYEFIILTFGNHDLYLISKQMSGKYKHDSLLRKADMKKRSDKIKGVTYLDGNTVTINGITYGGTGMWYDYSYARLTFNTPLEILYKLWLTSSNDANFVKGQAHDIARFAEIERVKLRNIIDQTDVIITHVGPDWSQLIDEYQGDLFTSFYYFDGQEFFSHIKEKTWCYGHTHVRYDYSQHNCRFINASLGYPPVGYRHLDKINKIITVEI